MIHLPGKFVWFEHNSHDVAKARAFYSALFGWGVTAMTVGQQPYEMIMLGNQSIGGYRTAEPGMPSYWGSCLSVDDVDESFTAATAAGAKGLIPPMPRGEWGRVATIADPTGAVFSLWRSNQGDPPDVTPTPVGGWLWNELFTTDAKAALAFYEKAFGMGHDAMDMGPDGFYYVLKDATGTGRAGLIQQPPGEAIPSSWFPYVAVADCDASVAKAMQFGATLVKQAADVPNMGRFAVVVDPLDAAFAIMTSSSM